MHKKQSPRLYGYLISAALSAAVTGIVVLGRTTLGLVGATVLYLVAVVIIGARIGRGPALLATALTILGLDYFVIPPVLQFEIAEVRHLVMLGGIGSVAIIVSNTTERLRRERERALAGDQKAEQARRAAETERTRSAILNTVSHDLRTPLATISASSQLLARNHESMSNAAKTELLSAIADEADRLEELLRNLVAMTRAESGKLGLRVEIGSIKEVIGSALRRSSRFLGNREVKVRSAGDPPFAAFDASLLEQVFVNLLENAAKHSPAAAPIDLSIENSGTEILVKVEDRGPGVALDEQEKVFEKFYRGRDASKTDGGVGLGLAICRAIVGAHTGTIRLANREGGGATVLIRLPAGHVSLREAEQYLPSLT
jgi:two-component system sensor histidine kinase KdpD